MFARTNLLSWLAVLVILATASLRVEGVPYRREKPGVCPLFPSAPPAGGSLSKRLAEPSGLDDHTFYACHNDYDCGNGPEKCCPTGVCCGSVCTVPWDRYP
ncbi:uncharacterized protein [Panulirus ornatus]|uniref:uncharacterized protein isoform X2 n=1 Tax=Panulirus ornatus TaxID=150431 RepID=UPI003A85EB3C